MDAGSGKEKGPGCDPVGRKEAAATGTCKSNAEGDDSGRRKAYQGCIPPRLL